MINGIVFQSEFKGDLKRISGKIYQKLDKFVEDDRFMDFSRLEIAFAIIGLVREEMDLPALPSQLEKIYNMKLHYFKRCIFILKMLYQPSSALMSYRKIVNPISSPLLKQPDKSIKLISGRKISVGYHNPGYIISRYTYSNDVYETIKDSFDTSTLDNSASITKEKYLGLKVDKSGNALNLNLNLWLDGNTMNNSNEYQGLNETCKRSNFQFSKV